MKIYACVKQVPDTESRLTINADQSGIQDTGVKWVMNPYDEYAVEEALKIRDAHAGSTVTVISVGPKSRVIDALRTALAMGADDAVVVDAPAMLDPSLTAAVLAAAVQKEGAPGIVLTGKLAIDDNAASVPQMLAERLGLPHVTVVGKVTVGEVTTIERDAEGGALEIFEVRGACVIAANKGLNTPRYASLPGIMKAKKKPLKELTLADCGVAETSAKTRLKNFRAPPEKPAVKMLTGDAATQARELVRLILEEAKVL